MQDAVDTVTRAPDDGWRYHPKYVEQFTDINKLYIFASCWTVIDIIDSLDQFRGSFFFTHTHNDGQTAIVKSVMRGRELV
jgi:hypothetical protein